ncbi:ferric reductase-like transmembrane domain-containing protein [Paracoccus denitrificans]|uniref:ferric reductase-like transmembrane domain-containing protein n=1 Tax=Paracoccus denitrificans TaxID=266 RepID=UPI001E3E06A0|nr:ferric reductase-like transmembrane domain-containing protein [Paracoccus denitrificans]UFS67426.1 ferric reductase-like transmembrane domain-containing protein [Paracoccus denitrificans]
MRIGWADLVRGILVWTGLTTAVAVPVAAAAASPLLAWREPIYIAAGFAGVIALALLLFQPLLAGGYLPGLPALKGRRVHRLVGGVLVAAVILHVAGLWVTSPPDMIDALLFRSPTPFSFWGVVAMWAVFASALMAASRRRWRRHPHAWRLGHTVLAAVIVVGSVVHALLIEGTMETKSKAILCGLLIAATIMAVAKMRGWTIRARRDS